MTQSAVVSIIEKALTFDQRTLALLASEYADEDTIAVRVYEYAKRGNDGLYSEWIYAIDTIPAVGPNEVPSVYHFGTKRVLQAT